jgi:hypothetical protein
MSNNKMSNTTVNANVTELNDSDLAGIQGGRWNENQTRAYFDGQPLWVIYALA